MNLDTLKREVFYIVEDELKEQMPLYDGYQEDIYELMTFFLDQKVDYNQLPEMIEEMFLNPPEVFVIEPTGQYKRYTLNANGLHETAIKNYVDDYLKINPKDEVLEYLFYTASIDEIVKALYERDIYIMRVFHNSIVGKSFAATTPIPMNKEKEQNSYLEIVEKLKKEKNWKIEFGIYSVETFDYQFMEDERNNYKK